MKKLALFSVYFLTLLVSCTKDDPPPQLTGTWNLLETFTTSGDTYTWTVTIMQDANNLTGNVVISDNSGYALLLSSSQVTGNTITLEWMSSTYKVSHQGTINSNFKSMNGKFFANGAERGTWLANKNE